MRTVIFLNAINLFWNVPEERVLKVRKGDNVQIRTKRGLPIKRIESLLLDGHEVFISITDRKRAWYYKKKFEKDLGMVVEHYPARYRNMDGYVYRVPALVQLYREMSEG